jgi:hypothetical protein
VKRRASQPRKARGLSSPANRTDLEEGHGRVLLHTRLVDEVVVDDDLAVGARQVGRLLRGLVRVLAGDALALLASRALQVALLEVGAKRGKALVRDDLSEAGANVCAHLVDDDAEDSRLPARVGPARGGNGSAAQSPPREIARGKENGRGTLRRGQRRRAILGGRVGRGVSWAHLHLG